MKNSSFGKKLLFLILGVTVTVLTIMMFFVSKYSYETGETDAKKYLVEMSGKYASIIKSEVDSSVIILRILASKFQESINNGNIIDKKEIIGLSKQILKDNPHLLGIWWSPKEKNVLFKPREIEDPKEWYTKNNHFSPYVTRANGNIILQPTSIYNEKNSWVKGPKQSGKEFMTKPYLFPIDDVPTLMTTISMPLYKDNKFFGAIGLEIDLNRLQKTIKKKKIYDNGYMFIIESNNGIVGHPQKELMGKNLLDIVKNDTDYKTMIQKTKENKEHMFFKESYKDGLESLYFSVPFQILGTGENWMLAISVPIDEYLENAIFIKNFSIIASLLALLIIAVVIIFIVKKLNTNLKLISTGVNSFFKYLNKEKSNSDQIEINSNDEFGQMAKNINENIIKISETLEEDNLLINNVKDVVQSVGQGHLNKRVENTTSTESLNELKNLLNSMLINLEKLIGSDINKLTTALISYSKRDFTAKLDTATSGEIGNKIMDMNSMITKMLQTSQKDGIELQTTADDLNENIKVLSNNATNQAASLEETAAAIDEITSNISQTSQKAQEMSSIAQNTKISANEGQKLATDTVNAMTDINETVLNINEAISVIDQIAFQTNILSLNAAVEAATAGEAGKGFAVVAQEVRNLASRSAEAAKEIKELVESATNKTDNGKQITNKMIEGYNHLETKINDTNNLIVDVTNAAKEQSIGMNQISDAVNQLDQFTQQNASIAEKSNIISQKTNEIAKEVVKSVSYNKFDGKDNVSQKVEIKQVNSTESKTLSHNKNSQWETF